MALIYYSGDGRILLKESLLPLYTTVQKTISSSVRRARTEKRLSRQAVSNGSGVSVQFILKLEKGDAVSLKQICAVGEYLGLSVEDLFGGRNEPEDSQDQDILREVLS